MSKLISLSAQSLTLAAALLVSTTAYSTTIIDTYHGGMDPQNYGDVIEDSSLSASLFDTYSLTASITGTILNVSIHTAFAGNAGVYTNYAANGIGYGDLFISTSWNPYGSAPYSEDNHTNGTVWEYGFNLHNRWSNSGGYGVLYQLNAGNNDSDIKMSNEFMSSGYYRKEQEVAVDTSSYTTQAITRGGWSVDEGNDLINFSIDIEGTSLLGSSNLAFHWGPTCANDVIEGEMPNPVPVPAAAWLFASGLLGLAGVSRRKK